MFGGIGKNFSICGYPFYEFKSRKQKIVPDAPVSHYQQECSTQIRLNFLNLSIFIVNEFFYVINCLKINRVTIFRAKCLRIVTLKVLLTICRGGSRTAATSNMEHFVIIVNGFQPLSIITKRSILDVAAVLGPVLNQRKKTLKLSISKMKLNITNASFPVQVLQ